MIHLLTTTPLTAAEYAGIWAALIVCSAIGILCFVKPEAGYMDEKGKFHLGNPPVKKIYTERDEDDWKEWEIEK